MQNPRNLQSARWKFLLGGFLIALVSNLNAGFPQGPDGLAYLAGVAVGGLGLGWVVWWLWSVTKGGA